MVVEQRRDVAHISIGNFTISRMTKGDHASGAYVELTQKVLHNIGLTSLDPNSARNRPGLWQAMLDDIAYQGGLVSAERWNFGENEKKLGNYRIIYYVESKPQFVKDSARAE